MTRHRFDHLGPRRKVRKVLKEFKAGTLRSGSGAKVRKRRQAIAAALKEARLARKHR